MMPYHIDEPAACSFQQPGHCFLTIGIGIFPHRVQSLWRIVYRQTEQHDASPPKQEWCHGRRLAVVLWSSPIDHSHQRLCLFAGSALENS